VRTNERTRIGHVSIWIRDNAEAVLLFSLCVTVKLARLSSTKAYLIQTCEHVYSVTKRDYRDNNPLLTGAGTVEFSLRNLHSLVASLEVQGIANYMLY